MRGGPLRVVVVVGRQLQADSLERVAESTTTSSRATGNDRRLTTADPNKTNGA
jgi:hypothetical protein